MRRLSDRNPSWMTSFSTGVTPRDRHVGFSSARPATYRVWPSSDTSIDPNGDLEPWETHSLLSEMWPVQRRLLQPCVEEADARYRALLEAVGESQRRVAIAIMVPGPRPPAATY